jgi:hypothetical protein
LLINANDAQPLGKMPAPDLTELRALAGGPPDTRERLDALQAAAVRALPKTVEIADQVFTLDEPPGIWYLADVDLPASPEPVGIVLVAERGDCKVALQDPRWDRSGTEAALQPIITAILTALDEQEQQSTVKNLLNLYSATVALDIDFVVGAPDLEHIRRTWAAHLRLLVGGFPPDLRTAAEDLLDTRTEFANLSELQDAASAAVAAASNDVAHGLHTLAGLDLNVVFEQSYELANDAHTRLRVSSEAWEKEAPNLIMETVGELTRLADPKSEHAAKVVEAAAALIRQVVVLGAVKDWVFGQLAETAGALNLAAKATQDDAARRIQDMRHLMPEIQEASQQLLDALGVDLDHMTDLEHARTLTSEDVLTAVLRVQKAQSDYYAAAVDIRDDLRDRGIALNGITYVTYDHVTEALDSRLDALRLYLAQIQAAEGDEGTPTSGKESTRQARKDAARVVGVESVLTATEELLRTFLPAALTATPGIGVVFGLIQAGRGLNEKYDHRAEIRDLITKFHAELRDARRGHNPADDMWNLTGALKRQDNELLTLINALGTTSGALLATPLVA